ncbi:MAG: OmpA family protein, partial [Myxococcales bacterium]|nr:OmpA family protein [Myxococcales bacterium]
MMSKLSAALTLSLGLGLILGLSGCPKKDDYPACRKDKDCKEGEHCVDKVCQNCQTNDDCKGKGPNGEDLPCVNFRCDENAAGCQSNDQCDPGMICLQGSCQFCTDNSQCESGVCNLDSGRCEPMPCQTDDDCPVDEVCDGGQCVYKPLEGDKQGAVCGISSLYFAFDSAKLTPSNQEQLKAAADCLIETLVDGKTLALEAHADNVGGEEYNILLTDRRGKSVL